MTDGMEMRMNDRLSWKRTSDGLLLVPEDQRKLILEEHNDAISAGHWGATRTRELITRNYW